MALAQPSIIEATGYWDNTGKFGDIFILWNNSGGKGYARLEAGNYSTNTIYSTLESCPDIRIGLYWITRMPFTTVFNFGFAKGYKCNSDTQQNCLVIPPTCSQKVQTTSYLDFPIYAADYSVPSTPSGLNVEPGDRNLKFTWNYLPNIFAYYLVLKDSSGTSIDFGYLPSNILTYTFSNLTNGITYTLHLDLHSHSDKESVTVTKSGTPVAPCLTPSVSFSVV